MDLENGCLGKLGIPFPPMPNPALRLDFPKTYRKPQRGKAATKMPKMR
jgi:hypothetical protein